jgi:hypothetical protein
MANRLSACVLVYDRQPEDVRMGDPTETLARAVIAASLISSGKFDLSAFDAKGERRSAGRRPDTPDQLEALLALADAWGGPEYDVRRNTALMALAKLSDAIYRAIVER